MASNPPAAAPPPEPATSARSTATDTDDADYADLLLGIDPADLDLDEFDSLSPVRPATAVAAAAGQRPAIPLLALVDTDDACVPSSQPNEGASMLLQPPPPPAAGTIAAAGPSSTTGVPAPTAAGLGATTATSSAYSPAQSAAAGPSSTSLGLGRPPAQQQGGPAEEADATSSKRRKVSRDSWTAGSPDRQRSDDGPDGGEGELDNCYGFVQPNLPFGSTQTPTEVSFMTARGTSFAPPSRAALERAAKLLNSVLSDDDGDDVGFGRAGSDGAAAWKGKGKPPTRVPFGVLEGENGAVLPPAALHAGARPGRSSLSTEPALPRPPPSATLLPDRRRLSAADLPSAPIKLPPLLSQAPSSTTASSSRQPPLGPPAAPTPINAPRPLPLPAHLSSTPVRRGSPALPASSSRTPIPLAGASTPLRRMGLSLGTAAGAGPRAGTPGGLGARAVGTPPALGGALGLAGGRGRKPFATPFKKAVGGPAAVVGAGTPVTPGAAALPGPQVHSTASAFAPAGPGGKAISVAGTPLRAGVPGDRERRRSVSSAANGGGKGGKGGPRTDYPRVFDLTLKEKRLSMRAAFIRPQFYSEDELVLYGLPDEIAAIDLSNASYYFFSPSAADADSPFKPVPTDVGSTDDGRLSWSDAHAALVQLGCTRLGPSPAGQPVFSTAAAGGGTDKALEAGLVWTRNHWELVLWKLACLCRARPPLFFSLPSAAAAAADVDDGEAEVEGMVRRGSESESEAEVEGVGGRWRKGLERADGAGGGQGKFGWDEMMRQLLYRYEREFNQGHRPCLQRIHEHDSSPAASMVLCVSAVPTLPATSGAAKPPTPAAPPSKPGAAPAPAPAVIELTDGWYRIAAEVDEVLALAIRRGKLRVGAKIGISGARLESTGSGAPPLKAHAANSAHLVLTANTTSLVRWDAQLGFVPPSARPFVACLSSLSPEGGLVPLMDVVVERCFPIGWVDQLAEGEPPGEPRGDKEERAARHKWEAKCEEEAQTIQDEVSKRLDDLLTLTERVERLVGSNRPSEAGGSAESEDQYEQLVEAGDKSAFLQTLDRRESANLASFMRTKYADDIGRVQHEVADELAVRCPQRQVRSFKIVKIRDAQTTVPALRTCQLTLWDAVQLGEEALEEGKRYLISNLSPGQKRSWAPPHSAGEVYLNSRRDTKWREVSGG